MDVRDKIYINGSWVASTGSGTLDVIDSTTEEVFATVPAGTAADIDKAVQAASGAFPGWAATSREERWGKLLSASARGSARTDEIAAMITHEVGMPLTLRAPSRSDCRPVPSPTPPGGRVVHVGRGDRELAGRP